MNVTANIVCYKSKTLANGEHPLMVRICKDGKKKYKSLGVSVNPKHWNFDRNTLKPNCPNYEYVSKLIADKTSELSAEIVKLKSERKEFTASTLIEDKSERVKPKTVHDLFCEQIQRLTDEGRRGYMLSVKQVYNSLLSFNKHLDICFSDIDVSFLRRYETWLRKHGLAENTIGIRFRTLRAIYNLAMEENIADSENYPFKKYKVARLHEETAKRSLSKEDIDRILAYKSTNRYMRFPIDIFAFTYYCGGINFIDIANLTPANIIEGKLIYKRHKTSKLIKIPLQPQAIELIKKYYRKDTPYLFPILSDFHQTEIQKSNRIHKVISKVNQRLKEIGEDLGLPLTLTTYVARHSQATVMKRASVSIAVIRVSHIIKGRIPEAIHKPANQLLESDKTIYYERMMFCIEVPTIYETVEGNKLTLTVGGVRAYNHMNLYSKKSVERFKIFVGFKNLVFCNLCVSSDGFVEQLEVSNTSDLYLRTLEMLNRYNPAKHLHLMQTLGNTSMTEHQFCQILGKMRLYQALPQKIQRNIPRLLITDTQINAVAKAYISDENFGSYGSDIDMWKFYNLLTGANKSSYIDSFLDRSFNATEVAQGINAALHGDDRYSWFID